MYLVIYVNVSFLYQRQYSYRTLLYEEHDGCLEGNTNPGSPPVFGWVRVVFGWMRVVFGWVLVVFGWVRVVFGWVRVVFGWVRVVFGWVRVVFGWVRVDFGWVRVGFGWIRVAHRSSCVVWFVYICSVYCAFKPCLMCHNIGLLKS